MKTKDESPGSIHHSSFITHHFLGGEAMNTLLRDVRYGRRWSSMRPALAAVAVLTRALGIGANTAIFSVVYGVLLRPLPFPESDRLMTINEFNAQQNSEPTELSFPNLSRSEEHTSELQSHSFISYDV